MVIYNEINPYAVQWLRNLSAAGEINPGKVLPQSIVELTPDDLRGATQVHFFAGIGLWSAALRMAGFPDTQAAWTASCPCQPFSNLGTMDGSSDARHLWPVLALLVKELRPPILLGEQVASASGRAWVSAVRTDLEANGYRFAAADLCASGVGAPHLRQRLFFAAVAHATELGSYRKVATRFSGRTGPWGTFGAEDLQGVYDGPYVSTARRPQPLLRKVDDGYPRVVGPLRAYGNSIVPQVAAAFIEAALGVDP